MSPVLDAVPTSNRRNRMTLLVLGTGATIGLHLGFLHLAIFRSEVRRTAAGAPGPWLTLFFFVASGAVFGPAVYALWRWVFPRPGGRTLASQIAWQALTSIAAITVVSVVSMEIVTLAFGLPSLFGTPSGVERTIIVTPAMRQMGMRLYAVMPVVPTVLLGLIG